MPDMAALREWVQHDDVKKQAAAAEKKAKAKCNELEETILESLIEEGVGSIKVTLEAEDVDTQAIAAIEEIEAAHEGASAQADTIVRILRARGLLVESRPTITKTVFIGSRIWASPVASAMNDDGSPKATDEDYERACAALAEAGWGEYVQTRFNIISLSSAIKEEVQNGKIVIPEGERETVAFDGTVRVVEKPQLNARKAKP